MCCSFTAVRLVCNFRTLAGGVVLVGSGLALRSCTSFEEYSDAFNKVVLPAFTKLVELSEGSSLCFTVQAESPSALNELWSIYKNGTLKHRLQEFLVTEEIKQFASGEDIKVTLCVEEQEYREAYLDLMLQQNQGEAKQKYCMCFRLPNRRCFPKLVPRAFSAFKLVSWAQAYHPLFVWCAVYRVCNGRIGL